MRLKSLHAFEFLRDTKKDVLSALCNANVVYRYHSITMLINHFISQDDYMTPKSAWEAIAHLIPKDKVIWEPFYGDGTSGRFLQELGFEVIHEPIDFFVEDHGDVIVSNPPFSMVKEVVQRLLVLKKPWILLMPVQKLSTQYFLPFNNTNLQLVIPAKRVNFTKIDEDGKVDLKKSKNCPFDCYYYFYDIKLDLPSGALLLR